jgi:hypothetical protein
MALFIFGAGATRGASFVDPTKDPCEPPLDTDFFTQLQRVRNPKHQKLIKQVMKDVVEVFGPNFDATMETVFSTLEHTIRMLGTTGDNRDFKRKDLSEKRDRLEQAIAVVLEESLCDKDDEGHSKLDMKNCEYHDAFIKLLQPGDEIISFNYDCILDDALRRLGNDKWNARYGYGFDLGPGGSRLTNEDYWQPEEPADKSHTVKHYKLHGSLHFDIRGTDDKPTIKLKQRPYTKQNGNLRFSIIPPEWHKAYDKGAFAKLWKQAGTAVLRAKTIVSIGYSLPPTDLHSTALFRTSVKDKSLKSLVTVNPDRDARHRTRAVLQRGLKKETRIMSYKYMSHFVATDRGVWT